MGFSMQKKVNLIVKKVKGYKKDKNRLFFIK